MIRRLIAASYHCQTRHFPATLRSKPITLEPLTFGHGLNFNISLSMPQPISPNPSASPEYVSVKDLSPTRSLGKWTWLVLMCLLAWDFSGLDRTVMHWIADTQGFILRNNWWLEEILHTRAKQFAIVIYLGLWAMIWWPKGVFRQLNRLQRTEIVVSCTLGLVTIRTLKQFSLTSCPWELQSFGGVATYVSHWNWGLGDGGAGRCFPGGHVSSALAFVGLALPWFGSGLTSKRQIGRLMLLGVLLLGLVLGLTQTLRGAHYPSHTFWTGFICWCVALTNHLLFGGVAHQRQKSLLRSA